MQYCNKGTNVPRHLGVIHPIAVLSVLSWLISSIVDPRSTRRLISHRSWYLCWMCLRWLQFTKKPWNHETFKAIHLFSNEPIFQVVLKPSEVLLKVSVYRGTWKSIVLCNIHYWFLCNLVSVKMETILHWIQVINIPIWIGLIDFCLSIEIDTWDDWYLYLCLSIDHFSHECCQHVLLIPVFLENYSYCIQYDWVSIYVGFHVCWIP